MQPPLTPLERAALDLLLRGNHERNRVLRDQIAGCREVMREFSENGFRCCFTGLSHTTPLPLKAAFALGGVMVMFEGLGNLGVFRLHVEDGYVSTLRGSMHNQHWPESGRAFRVLDLRFIVCPACQAHLEPTELAESERERLRDRYLLQNAIAERRMLLRVRDFYVRYPEVEGRVMSHSERVMESKDPEIMRRLDQGVPFDEIVLPPEKLPLPESAEREYGDVIDYLRVHKFTLGPRLMAVNKFLAMHQREIGAVSCPRCGNAQLRVEEPPYNDIRVCMHFHTKDETEVQGPE